jgi:hypothetical protein
MLRAKPSTICVAKRHVSCFRVCVTQTTSMHPPGHRLGGRVVCLQAAHAALRHLRGRAPAAARQRKLAEPWLQRRAGRTQMQRSSTQHPCI